MNWALEITTETEVKRYEGVEMDPFANLNTQEPGARISMSVQRSEEYGAAKCSCNVTINCPQEAAKMDEAARLAFTAAVNYVNWGISHIAPHLPPLKGPQ